MIFLTEGNIPLNAAYDDNIVQEANSTYQLTFKFPTNNILWQRLREEAFLTADDLRGEQDFVIFEVEKKHGYIQVYANQVMTLLNNYVVNPISLDRQTGSTALSRFAGSITRDNPFSFFSNIEDRHTFNIDSKNAMDAFAKDKHSILGLWGGDLVRHGYQVRLLKNGGSENESLFMYQKNLSSYEHKTSTKSLRTRITFVTTIRGEGEKPVDKHYKVVVDSPLISKYSQIYEDVVEVNDQDVVDEATLLKYGKQYFRTTLCDMLEDSIEIDVIGQSDVPVQMYDVVSVYHGQFDLDVRKKITKYNYSPMAKKLKSIGFGDFKSGLANAIGNAVSDAVKSETQHLQGQFATQLAKEIKNADLDFDRKKEELVNQFTDELNAAKAKSEEVKRQIADEIDKKFQSFDNASIQEARQKAEEALKNAGASNSLAEEAKRISERTKTQIDNLKSSSQTAIEQIEAFKTQYGTKLNEVQSTADGLFTKMGAIETYISKDGQRQEELKRYARTESASQVSAVREQISRDYVGKNTFQESVQGVERRLASLSLGTSGNLLKNSNVGFYNQHDKRYRLVETLQENQTYTLVTKYWNGENATGHTFFDGVDWRKLNYNPAIDAWMVQFTPTKVIPAGTEITLSSDPYESQGNMDWATLVRGAIPLIHWQPAKGDVEEGVTQKLAEYKETVDGRFATISSQIDNKANQSDFQSVKETSQLYERIIGRNENDISNKVARMALTNQLFQVEVSKYSSQGGPNLIKNSGNPQDNINWGYWEIGQSPAIYVGTHSFFYNQKRKLFFLDNHTKIGVPASTVRFSLKRSTNYTVSLTAFNTWNMKGATIYFLGRKVGENQTFTRVVTLADNVKFSSDEAVRKNYTFNSGECDEGYIRIDNNGTNDNEVAILLFGDVDVYEGTVTRPWQPSPEDTNEAIRTVQSQLAGSWAVQNLTSAGSIVSQINATNNQILIEAEKIRLKGKTLLDELTAIQGYFKRLFVGEGAFTKLNAEIIGSRTITADKLIMDQAMARMFVSSDIFTDTLAAKEAFINKLRSVVVSATLLEGYKGKIGGFQIGTHEKDSSVYWITGQNQFAVGMSNGSGDWSQTALWVNWGNDWGRPSDTAWFVKHTGQMFCYNRAHFWNDPTVYGDLIVTGNIKYYPEGKILGGAHAYWLYSGSYKKVDSSNGYMYFYAKGDNYYDWIPMNKEISDRRYKTNIEASAVSGLDVVESLKTYSYRKEYDGKIEDIACGIMAQDVQKYAPEAFYENPDGAYSYRTFELVPYLIKAIQELNQKIEKLEKTA